MNTWQIIKSVVDAMIPVHTGLSIAAPQTSPYVITGFENTRFFYVGQSVRVIGDNPVVDVYCKITAVGSASLTVSSDTLLVNGGDKPPSNTVEVQGIMNFYHGNRLEIANLINEMSQNASYKEQIYPGVVLFHDYKEVVKKTGYDREASLNIVIFTDSKQEYSATERYTNKYDPILTPLYDLFIDRLRHSKYISPDFPEHNRIDRLSWGKAGLNANVADMFNEFIDAIEIENLNIKIFKTC